MYVIGNSRTSDHVPMWNDVITTLRNDSNIGKSLELCCPRHPDTFIEVSTPDDFLRLSPEGGCDLKCGQILRCGHVCSAKCHSGNLHAAVRCLEPCPRLIPDCGHNCPSVCGDPCPNRCVQEVYDPDRVLPCGHHKAVLPCWQSQDLSMVFCSEGVKRTVPDCGHEITIQCGLDTTAEIFRCPAKCGTPLPCGHNCSKPCTSCRKTDGRDIKIDHGVCRLPCGRKYASCGHTCKAKCHGDSPCPSCEAPCENRCSHSSCPKKCSEPCPPCTEERCASSCPHSTCTMPCSAPCNWIPCSKRCEQLLSCGHQCKFISFFRFCFY